MLRNLSPLSHEQVVDRARSAIGHKTRYVLGTGGRNPDAVLPGTVDGDRPTLCDCSGFAAWCYGVDRYLPNNLIPGLPEFEKWFETSQLFHDARSTWGYVTETPWDTTLPGDLVVWPDEAWGTPGHVGIIAEIGNHGPARVVHCSSGNFKAVGDAIQETGIGLFLRHKALAARVRWVR